MLGLLSQALGQHRQNRESKTPNSLLKAIKLWYTLPALLHSHDGPVKRRERFVSVDRGDITLSISWLMGYTRRASGRRSIPAHETTVEAKFKRASSAGRHPGCVTMAARSLLVDPRSNGSEATWQRVKAKFPDDDSSSVSEAATAAVAASASGVEEESGPMWRTVEGFDP